MSRFGIGLITTLLLAPILTFGATFNMDPWIMILEPYKGNLSQILTLSYTEMGKIPNAPRESKSMASRPVAVEISLLNRDIDSNGTVYYPSGNASNEFMVFPSQIVMYPGEVQKVQIQWVGKSIPAKEVAYGLIAAQLPVKLDINPDTVKTALAVINVLTRYEGILKIIPGNVKPEIVVDTTYFLADSSGTKMVMWVSNKGTGMQKLKDVTVAITPYSSANKLEFANRVQFKPDIKPSIITQSVFPGQRRRLVFPWPSNVPIGKVTGAISLEQ